VTPSRRRIARRIARLIVIRISLSRDETLHPSPPLPTKARCTRLGRGASTFWLGVIVENRRSLRLTCSLSRARFQRRAPGGREEGRKTQEREDGGKGSPRAPKVNLGNQIKAVFWPRSRPSGSNREEGTDGGREGDTRVTRRGGEEETRAPPTGRIKDNIQRAHGTREAHMPRTCRRGGGGGGGGGREGGRASACSVC